jgi:hypothetical protein
MMIVYSPVIEWGFFGFGGGADLPAKLQLGVAPKYIIATLVLHLIYGTVIGWGNARWTGAEGSASRSAGAVSARDTA